LFGTALPNGVNHGGRRTDTLELNRVISHQREVDTPEIEL